MPAPADAHDLVTLTLADLSDERQEVFRARLNRWWPDLVQGLSGLYDATTADAMARRLTMLAAMGYADRDLELHHLDLVRSLQPDWMQLPTMLGYATYAERFAGDLKGVESHIPYLQELGVTYLHLMPLLQPREGDSDGGYAVADYRRVRSDLGDMDDLARLASSLRENGISLVLDLVLNHVAREHEWAVKAREGNPHFRDYFYIFPDREQPDAYERTLPEIFPDFAPGSFTWDDEAKGWVWTTFNSWQWDVNWTNPEVLLEYAEIILFLANKGVEVLRLDAIAFMWKRLGTACQNQPEVHSITQVLRTLARIACPALGFKAEAIVGPQDLVQYLGQGVHLGKVSDLAYHNSLMVQIWSMLAAEDTRLAVYALRNLPPAPTTSAWITYVRCHDDIGWAISDEDADAVGASGFWHRQFLADYYVGDFPGSNARGLTFQANPVTRDRRISGTTASLVGLDLELEVGNAGSVDAAVRRYLLTYAVVMAWGGIPVIWSGDELAMPNDPDWADEPGHGGDNRWAHRPRLDWALAEKRHDLSTPTGRVFAGLRHLAQVRAGLEHLHASVAAEVLPVHDAGVFAVLRRHPVGPLLCLYNVTGSWRPWPRFRLAECGLGDPVDAITGEPPRYGDDGNLWLAPYTAWWLLDR